MRALAITIVLAVFVLICSAWPMLGLVLFTIFGLPPLIAALLLFNTKLGLAALGIVISIGIYFLPWVVIPAVMVCIVILGVAGV